MAMKPRRDFPPDSKTRKTSAPKPVLTGAGIRLLMGITVSTVAIWSLARKRKRHSLPDDGARKPFEPKRAAPLEFAVHEMNGSPSSTQLHDRSWPLIPRPGPTALAEVDEIDGGNPPSAPGISKVSHALKIGAAVTGVALAIFLSGWFAFRGFTPKDGLEVNPTRAAGARGQLEPVEMLTFVGGKSISAAAKRSNDIYVAIFMSVEAQYDAPPGPGDLDAISGILAKNGLTVFDTRAAGYTLRKGSRTYELGPSTLRSPGIVYLRPELEATARKIQRITSSMGGNSGSGDILHRSEKARQ